MADEVAEGGRIGLEDKGRAIVSLFLSLSLSSDWVVFLFLTLSLSNGWASN